MLYKTLPIFMISIFLFSTQVSKAASQLNAQTGSVKIGDSVSSCRYDSTSNTCLKSINNNTPAGCGSSSACKPRMTGGCGGSSKCGGNFVTTPDNPENQNLFDNSQPYNGDNFMKQVQDAQKKIDSTNKMNNFGISVSGSGY